MLPISKKYYFGNLAYNDDDISSYYALLCYIQNSPSRPKSRKRKKRINMFKVLKIFDLDTRLVRFINQGRIKQKNTNAFLVDASAKGGGVDPPPPFLNLIKSNTNKIINISSYLKLPKCKELD